MKKIYLPFIVGISALTLTACAWLLNPYGTQTEENIPEPEIVENVLPKQEMSLVCSDLNENIAPSKGNVKMLVVPISFAGSTANGYEEDIIPWTTTRLNNVNSYYFGSNDSLAKYYQNASFGKANVSGMVSEVYQNTTLSISQIMSGNYYNLFTLIRNATEWVMDTREEIDWSEYDLNDDGCIDNIHLITDYHCQEWNAPLWPHMFNTGMVGTLERPLPNVYSISGTYFVNDAITAIHEQGHIFGLQDYYDYSNNGNSSIDYIGYLDMQSHNVFDWNSYSKLSMGWVQPYVMTNDFDEVKVTLEAASLSGDCLLIPANSNTWNGSAFDEYFLLELFAPYGNNEKDWNTFKNSLGDKPGIRLYHVDSRVYGGYSSNTHDSSFIQKTDFNDQQINSKEDVALYPYNSLGCNNSSDYTAYPNGIEALKEHELLSIVQKGGSFTFATVTGRHQLNKTDLFTYGDTFTFEKYSKFCNKKANKQTLTNKGEVFPYEITIEGLNNQFVTLTVKRVNNG